MGEPEDFLSGTEASQFSPTLVEILKGFDLRLTALENVAKPAAPAPAPAAKPAAPVPAPAAKPTAPAPAPAQKPGWFFGYPAKKA